MLARMGTCRHPEHRVVTVAGTNGKGSSVAMLETILRQAGYRVGAYTSPHLMHYRERIRVDGREVTDTALRDAFARVDEARGDTSLTYFEFGTLAAIHIFAQSALDVAIMEVGMGGRLDAVNLLDPDVALVTAVDLDHTDWLGRDREAIGREKAGIFRAARPAVCSDPHPPLSLYEHAQTLGTDLRVLSRDFGFAASKTTWSWRDAAGNRHGDLPLPALKGNAQLNNAAGVLMVLSLLSDFVPVSSEHIREGLSSARAAGRFQVIPGDITLILDVAHNPQSARALAENLTSMPITGRTHAVLGMLADKDIPSTLDAVGNRMDTWHMAGLSVPRGASAAHLQAALRRAGFSGKAYEDVGQALRSAFTEGEPGDRIVVFGSFHTVAEALATTL